MNRRCITIVLTGLVAMAVIPVASAAPTKHPGHFQRLAARRSHQLDLVRTQLKAERTQVAALQGSVVSLNGQVTGLQSQAMALAGQVTALQGALAQRTGERDAAQAQAASLQARLDAIPTPMDVAVEQVRREVTWAQSGQPVAEALTAPTSFSRGELVAIAAMNYVEGHVSMAAYGYLGQPSSAFLPLTPDGVLGAQAGMCGHAALAFAAIVKRFGYQVRSVQFYWNLPPYGQVGHIADEVYYDGGWHYFDSFFGAFWRDSSGNIEDITTIRASGGTETRNVASFTNVIEDAWYGAWINFEIDPATTVTLDQQPFYG